MGAGKGRLQLNEQTARFVGTSSCIVPAGRPTRLTELGARGPNSELSVALPLHRCEAP